MIVPAGYYSRRSINEREPETPRAKVLEVIELLKSEFLVDSPLMVVIDGRRLRARVEYNIYTKRFSIKLPRHCWRGWVHSLLHEFAHVLDHTRHGFMSGHQEFYRQALMDVVRAWFTNPEQYSWNTEYEAIQSWHERTRA